MAKTLTVEEAVRLRDRYPADHPFREEGVRALLRGYRRTHPFDRNPPPSRVREWAAAQVEAGSGNSPT